MPLLGVVLTGYRLLTTIVIVGVGIPKAVYSYNGRSLISPSLDWVGGIIFTLLLGFIPKVGLTKFVELTVFRLFWLGVIEATRPELCPSFFQEDLAPAILRILRRDSTPRHLPRSDSRHPTFPVTSIPERSCTDSRAPLSPATQRAVTMPLPLQPNTTPSVSYYSLSPSIVMQEEPLPLAHTPSSRGGYSSLVYLQRSYQ